MASGYYHELGRREMSTRGYEQLFGVSNRTMAGTKWDTFREAHADGRAIGRVADLASPSAKEYGVSEVHVGELHRLVGMPIPQQQRAEGRERRLTETAHSFKVGRYRMPIEDSGVWNEANREIKSDMPRMKNALIDWHLRVRNEMFRYYLFGDRGDRYNEDQNIALRGHPDFDQLFVNTLRPASRNRHFQAQANGRLVTGNPAGLTATSVLNRELFRNLRFILDESDRAMNPIALPDWNQLSSKAARPDLLTDCDVRQVVIMSPAAFRQLQANLGNEYNELQTATMARRNSWSSPVFFQEGLFLEGFYIIKDSNAVHFNPGSSMLVANNDVDSTLQAVALPNKAALGGTNPKVERIAIIGAQALMAIDTPVTEEAMYKIVTRGDADYEEYKQACIKCSGGIGHIMSRSRSGVLTSRGLAHLDVVVDYAQ